MMKKFFAVLFKDINNEENKNIKHRSYEYNQNEKKEFESFVRAIVGIGCENISED